MTEPARSVETDRLPHPVTGELFTSPVEPGSGWPGDRADASTPVARRASSVRRMARQARSVEQIDAEISVCAACPRLVAWREEVAREKRASYAGEPYWGRPVPGFGASAPRILVVGLAPAAQGANRTGRNFTGDRSGDWLYASMHRVGLATRARSVAAGDGLDLPDTRIVAAVRCAPPANKPTTRERDTCGPWLAVEVRLVLPGVRAIVAAGTYGWDATWRALAANGVEVPRPRPRFGHGARVQVANPAADGADLLVLGCYHPSQHNTFTGRLTEPMTDAVFHAASHFSR